ncbi:Segregation and condensation protein B [Chlamydiales bacterium STE3]|nr:Segregation and condensation protein B [Chlamydiales bacterium STE3]
MKEINLLQLETETSTYEQEQQLEQELKTKAKRIIEALLFASSEPLSFQKIVEVISSFAPFKARAVKELIEDLKVDYISQERAFRLEEVATGYTLKTCEEYSSYIEMLFRSKRGEKLSQAAAEVLAIIAYKQPITRPQIDALRGVDSSGTIHNLLERQLIEATGKLEAPGRPTLYGITQHFLSHFGLRNINELPSLNHLMS